MKAWLRTAVALWAMFSAPMARAADSAVILMYHRFGESRHPATNIRNDQLDAQLARLQAGGYTVVPLGRIVDSFTAGAALPDKTVALTVDDAFASFYHNAWPRLRKAGLPVTLFVVTDEADGGGSDMMTWDQIREVAASGLVTIGTQGAAHPRLPFLSPAEVEADLSRARQRIAEVLGAPPTFLAWPYGEASRANIEVARRVGFTAAFAQHSGVAWAGADPFLLPRFAQNETYGRMERFSQVVDALPLRVADMRPADPLLAANPPRMSLTLAEDAAVGCYAEGAPVAVRRDGMRLDLTLDRPFRAGRVRINCTAPAAGGRWRWFGWQFSVP